MRPASTFSIIQLSNSRVSIGDGTYINSNLTLVDDYKITIGKNVLIAPNVTISGTNHPMHYKARPRGEMYCKEVVIEDHVWIASNVTILPGVTIGDHSIIGAGSVVTKDIPPNVIAFGHPAEVHREITEEDEIFYDHGKRISEHIVLDIHG